MDSRFSTCVHEAAHAMAFLAGGCRVQCIRVNGDGSSGACSAPPAAAPETKLLAACAGNCAEQIIGDNAGAMASLEDGQLVQEALFAMGEGLEPRKLARYYDSTVVPFLEAYKLAIIAIACALDNRGVLHAEDLAELTRRVPELQPWSHLYSDVFEDEAEWTSSTPAKACRSPSAMAARRVKGLRRVMVPTFV